MTAYPWRWTWPPIVVALAALGVGVPLFLRTPPWLDVTLYDVAARNLLAGGVHYRDVFDTNLPGYVWILKIFRSLFGWSVEALRASDLLIVGLIAFLCDRIARRAGASLTSRLWAFAGLSCFYPYAGEVSHMQRDTWMLLPALAATTLRMRRVTLDCHRGFFAYVLEGLLWASAVWIKPHVVIPATVVWLAASPFVVRRHGWRTLFLDAAGTLTGGLLLGAAGVFHLVLSGTWDSFVEVFTVWNKNYAQEMWSELDGRYRLEFLYFPPWTYLNLLGIPLALWSLIPSRTRDDMALSRSLYAALYLGWLGQALIVQRQFHYVHVPETLLVFGLIAMHRLAWTPLVIAAVIVTSLCVNLGVVEEQVADPANITGDRQAVLWIRHPAFHPKRLALVPQCLRVDTDVKTLRKLRDDLEMSKGFHAVIGWEELGEVEDFLRAQNIQDRELLCWEDSPHALYLNLGILPGFRFQHVGQMRAVNRARVDQERDDVLPNIRFVIGDLQRVHDVDEEDVPDVYEPGTKDDLLPARMHSEARERFPYSLPTVFRSRGGQGRYTVHLVK